MDRDTLHYALDNASLIVRRVPGEICIPFDLASVDRRGQAQNSSAYKTPTSVGRIPALKTLAQRIEDRASTATVAKAEGLGPTPFSTPSLPYPPKGSAL